MPDHLSEIQVRIRVRFDVQCLSDGGIAIVGSNSENPKEFVRHPSKKIRLLIPRWIGDHKKPGA